MDISWVKPLKGKRHFVYTHVDYNPDADPKIMITKAGTIYIEMNWIPVTSGIAEIGLKGSSENEFDDYAERLLERSKHEASMVA